MGPLVFFQGSSVNGSAGQFLYAGSLNPSASPAPPDLKVCVRWISLTRFLRARQQPEPLNMGRETRDVKRSPGTDLKYLLIHICDSDYQ